MVSTLKRYVIYSITVGSIIALLTNLIENNELVSNPGTYIFSVTVTLITIIVTENIYKRYLIQRKIDLIKKILISYFFITTIYILSNLVMIGFSIFTYLNFYLFNIMILIIVTPALIILDKRLSTYNYYLTDKQNRNSKKT